MIHPPQTASASAAWRAWAEAALLLILVTLALLPGAWRAGAAAVTVLPTPNAELRACQHRVSVGYARSGIPISTEDALTIYAACDRAVREHRSGPLPSR